MFDLPVCKKCGWHWVMPHSDCDPEAGKTADKLIEVAKAMGIEATKFGYGQKRVAFNFCEDYTVVVQAYKHGRFEFDHVHVLQSFQADTEAAKFLAPFLMFRQLMKGRKW